MQQGIQAAHAAVELGMKAYKKQMRYREGTDFKAYYDWATNWKTMVFLNGGDAEALRELEDFLYDPQNDFPWAAFYEDASFYNALTSIAIILPESIFGTSENMRKLKPGEQIPRFAFTKWEYELIERLAAARRAV
jgi:hypothetical protein